MESHAYWRGPAVDVWMADNLPKEAAIGVDTWCVSIDTAKRWEHAFARKHQKLVQTSKNLVDEVWKNQPPPEINPVIIHPLEFSGRSIKDKLNDLRENLKQEKARGIIITALDEVAWLYNIRGSDVSYCPVVYAFAIVTSNLALLYVDKRKVSSEVLSYMEDNGIEVREYGAVSSDVALLASNQLNALSAEMKDEFELIWADPTSCCYALYSKLDADKVLLRPSPLALAKAIKNIVELEGLKRAHVRDGAAVVQYLVWLDHQMQEIYGASGYFLADVGANKKSIRELETMKLTEVTASDKLEGFRASKRKSMFLTCFVETAANLCSFPLVFVWCIKPHPSHHSTSLTRGLILLLLNLAWLISSPGKLELGFSSSHFRGLSFPTISSVGPNAAIIHYAPRAETCAELDPTKSIFSIREHSTFWKPSEHEKACYTAENAHFPNGTNGNALDILARVPLWKYGLDYRHGTGHGIGSYLNVHEGKLENVLIIKDAGTKFNFGDKGYLSFEHITWAPYQRKLIELSLLIPEEIDWLNSYHSKCRDILAPYLNESESAWLKKATEPISI
ncbi:hypothetical protein RGQ29_031932 [Quercus rubra]|uniref:Xaa-Pro aminopeptidase P n=1 Tax=Quercus rubra TaxID=3512 RepID=A0AAN7HXU2_QUERU|nr:hypothetical protein RGQ29_031932 [Quercus rubra]